MLVRPIWQSAYSVKVSQLLSVIHSGARISTMRIFGPCRSHMMPTRAFKGPGGRRHQIARARCSSPVPWEKFMRTRRHPARSCALRNIAVGGSPAAGVATIFVFFDVHDNPVSPPAGQRPAPREFHGRQFLLRGIEEKHAPSRGDVTDLVLDSVFACGPGITTAGDRERRGAAIASRDRLLHSPRNDRIRTADRAVPEYGAGLDENGATVGSGFRPYL